MSYILDALRRADSERERGAVPSIHSPPTPPVADEPKPSRGAQPQTVLVAVIVLLLLALAGLLAWHLMGNKEAPAQAVVDHGAPGSSAATPMVTPAPDTPQASPLAYTPPPQAMAPQAPAPTRMAPQAQPQPRPQQSPPTLDTAQPVVTVPARTIPPPSSVATTPSTEPEADTRIHTLNDLPPNIQRELPKLVVGGAMYSEVPSNRMLIINSQVFHEGDKLSPDLQLQEIRLKSAVFKYKGYRYGVSY